eukprot:jgi/Botrbrau1/9361/Bobra.354_2s0018.2
MVKRPLNGRETDLAAEVGYRTANVVNLVDCCLTALPDGITPKAISLDASNNSISTIPSERLPVRLISLALHRNPLSDLPDLSRLTALQQLGCIGCKLESFTTIFTCPMLRHAGLGYNAISILPATTLVNKASLLVSLDLSHNDLWDLQRTTPVLRSLPSLRILSLKGNPFCLLAAYPSYVQLELPQLEHFDGKPVLTGGSTEVSQINAPLTQNVSGAPGVSSGFSNQSYSRPMINACLEINLTEVLPAAEHVTDRLQNVGSDSGVNAAAGTSRPY